jgi:hypothetical protein
MAAATAMRPTRAQQRALPVIGYLSSNQDYERGDNRSVAVFRRGRAWSNTAAPS